MKHRVITGTRKTVVILTPLPVLLSFMAIIDFAFPRLAPDFGTVELGNNDFLLDLVLGVSRLDRPPVGSLV